jgi:hypothetical protein
MVAQYTVATGVGILEALRRCIQQLVITYRDTPQKCHFTQGFCMLIFSIAGVPGTYSIHVHPLIKCESGRVSRE